MKSYRSFYIKIGFGLAAAVVVAAFLSVILGPVRLSPAQMIAVLFHGERESGAANILLYARLPRTIATLVTGAALATAGALIQTVFQNPLASPHIIGVNSGAGFFVALGLALFPRAVSALPLFAFFGALFGVLIVLFIGEKTGASRLTLILSGVALSAMFSGAVDLIVSLLPGTLSGYADFRIGGFGLVTMRRVLPATAVIAVTILLALLLSGELDVMALGEETAESLGLRFKQMRFVLLFLAAALAGAAVSVAGMLGFVGLIVPHAVRRMSRNESLPLLIFSALAGAFFLTLCDLIARLIVSPYELPVGIVLSFLGGPFFLYLLWRQKRR